MTKQDLGRALRSRQIADRVEDLSDEAIIDCYNRCSSCGKRAIPIDDLELAITASTSAEEFVQRLDALDSKEPDRAHLPGCLEKR